MRNFLAASAALLALPGCTTTLYHQQLKPGAQPDEPGFTYYLPRQRFTVTATYELKSCPDAAGDGEAKRRELHITQSASIVESPVADPGELYSIPIKSLTSGWKTTSLTGTVYDNQTLHTFGATADDRSGGVVKGALGTALSVARIAIGTPVGAAPQRLCRPDVYKALDVLRESRTKLLDASLDEKARASWAAAVSAAKSTLQVTEVYVLDPTPETQVITNQLAGSKRLAWFANPALIATAGTAGVEKYNRTLTTVAKIKDAPTEVAKPPENLAGKGVIYRVPAPVVAQVCAGACDGPGAEVLATLDSQAGQFGRYAIIPLKNRPFEKNNLSLSFASNGRLESFTYGEESRFEKMATTASESMASIEGVVAKRKAADEAAAEAASGAELKTIKAETELLKAKADKIEAETRLNKLQIPQ